jgi:hypothetical protein
MGSSQYDCDGDVDLRALAVRVRTEMIGRLRDFTTSLGFDYRYIAELQKIRDLMTQARSKPENHWLFVGSLCCAILAIFSIIGVVLAAIIESGAWTAVFMGSIIVNGALASWMDAKHRKDLREREYRYLYWANANVPVPEHALHESCQNGSCAVCSDRYEKMGAWRRHTERERRYLARHASAFVELAAERDRHQEQVRQLEIASQGLTAGEHERLMKESEQRHAALADRIVEAIDAYAAYQRNAAQLQLRMEQHARRLASLRSLAAGSAPSSEIVQMTLPAAEATERALAEEFAALDAVADTPPAAEFRPDRILC